MNGHQPVNDFLSSLYKSLNIGFPLQPKLEKMILIIFHSLNIIIYIFPLVLEFLFHAEQFLLKVLRSITIDFIILVNIVYCGQRTIILFD